LFSKLSLDILIEDSQQVFIPFKKKKVHQKVAIFYECLNLKFLQNWIGIHSISLVPVFLLVVIQKRITVETWNVH